jgi:hypothetical protein
MKTITFLRSAVTVVLVIFAVSVFVTTEAKASGQIARQPFDSAVIHYEQSGSVIVSDPVPDEQSGTIIVVDPNPHVHHDTLTPQPWYPSTWKYVKAIGGSYNEEIYSAIITSNGRIVMTGFTDTFGAGNKDLLLINLTQSGNRVWARTLGGSGNEEGRSVIETYDGGLVVVGYTNSFSGPQDNLLLTKFSAAGNMVWTKVLKSYYQYPEPLEFKGYSVIEGSNHDLVVTGTSYRAATQKYSVLLARYGYQGNLIRHGTVYNASLQDHYGYSVAEACDGKYLVVGSFDGETTGEDMLLLLVDFGDLDLVKWGWWISEPGNNNPERAYAVTRTSDCGFAITGITGDDLVYLRFDSAYDEVFYKKLVGGSSEGHAIIETNDGGIVAAGGYSGGSGDVLLVKWDSSGTLKWTRSFGGAGYDISNSILKSSSGSLFAIGYTDSWGAGGYDALVAKCTSDGKTCLPDKGGPASVDWSPYENWHPVVVWVPLSTDNLNWLYPTITSPNLEDTTICSEPGVVYGPEVDIEPIPDVDTQGTGKLSPSQDHEIHLQNYPNPFNPTTTISFSVPKPCDYTLTIYNMLGQEVAAYSGAAEPGEVRIEWDGTKVASGVYFYKLTAGTYSDTKKMMLLK